MANKKYKLTDGNMWATDGIHDFGQNKTQRTINSEVNSALGGKAPTNHASTATTYGAASTSNYGHVKLSNTTPSMDGTAAVGDSTDVARANHVHPSDTSRVPTSRKVNNKQLSSDITLSAADVSAVPTSRKVNDKQLSADITLSASDVGAAPTSHASTATTYGKGTSSNYGHVKISDSLTDTTTAATGGVVPSMKAVSDLNGAINVLSSDLAPVLTEFKADTNLIAGNLRVYNNKLYRVTSQVSSGDALIVGTNVAEVNLTNVDDSFAGSTNGYDKRADGTLLQWGFTEYSLESNMVQVGSLNLYYTSKQIQFPIPFYGAMYSLSATSQYSTGFVFPAGGQSNTASSCTIFVYDVYQRTAGATPKEKIWWQAIGRWRA